VFKALLTIKIISVIIVLEFGHPFYLIEMKNKIST